MPQFTCFLFLPNPFLYKKKYFSAVDKKGNARIKNAKLLQFYIAWHIQGQNSHTKTESDSVLKQDHMSQRKPIFWHTLHNVDTVIGILI